jgi:internalin A
MREGKVPRNFRSCVSADGTQVSLANRGLASVPAWLRNVPTITSLNLRANRLKMLPDWLGNLTALTSLDLGENLLVALPESLGNLTALTSLDLRSNKLTALPESFGNLTVLTSLNLVGNKLAALPESFGNLTALTSLNLRSNELAALPESFGNLNALSSLNLRSNELAALPESFGNLNALTSVDLGANKLAALPESVSNLAGLTSMSLVDNHLTGLPRSLGNLTDLQAINLSGNRLTVLPDSLGNLASLNSLNLSDNELVDLPESLGNLAVLTTLDLRANQLHSLPRQMAGLLTEGLLPALERNPLDDPLPELIRRGTDALATYLRNIEDAVAQYEAKLLFVGAGNVGKTSLVAALLGAPFIEGRETTHGIEITPLILHHPLLGREMTLRAWDFGGQDVYRVTHQFFFSHRALYVVVWNSREGEKQDEVETWLRRIRLRVGRDARAVLVATHCDERRAELDYPQLARAYPKMLVGSFEVDSRTQSGVPALRTAMSREAAKLPQMGGRISLRWVAARDEILSRAQDEPQILYQQFREVCQRHGMADDEILTLAQLMHDLGHIIYYSDDEGLKDVVVLNPEWLTKAISYVLEDKPTREAGGILDHIRLKVIWQDRDGGVSYPARLHPYFLRLMEKFDISYRIEGDELHSLVAQMVPYERPALPWPPRKQLSGRNIRTLSLVCHLAEPAPGLIPWLTVRHHRAATGVHWRHGVFLRHPVAAYASEAVVELRHDTDLTVEVRAPSPDLYFNVLRESIEDLIALRWPGLTYELLIPCPGKGARRSTCLGRFPLEKLLRMRERDRPSVMCWECMEDYGISELLTGFGGIGQPLAEQLARIERQIGSSVAGLQSQAAAIAESVRRILRVVSTEVADCPRIFTLVPQRATGIKRAAFYENNFRLTLWCEHPGFWHPWDPANYTIRKPKEWFVQISPYVRLVLRTLQLIVPLAGAITEVVMSPDQLAQTEKDLHLMSAVVADLPVVQNQSLGRAGIGSAIDQRRISEGERSVAEDEALRALRAVLFEQDRLRTFGGLRRVQAPSGEFLWVCRKHYPEYDPGLPVVPGTGSGRELPEGGLCESLLEEAQRSRVARNECPNQHPHLPR